MQLGRLKEKGQLESPKRGSNGSQGTLMTPDNMPPVPPQRFDVGACPVLVAGCVCSRRRGSSNFGSGQSVSLLERPCRTQAEATAPCCAEAYRRNSIIVVAAANRPAVQSGDGVPEPQKPQSQDRHPARLLGEGIERALPASSIQIPRCLALHRQVANWPIGGPMGLFPPATETHRGRNRQPRPSLLT